MVLLIIGVVLFCLTHLLPAIAPDVRKELQVKFGDNAYRGFFSLAIVASLVLIVIGWRRATPAPVYAPPLMANPVTSALILVGLILFVASQVQGKIKRVLRHPQMTGTILWGAAHLLTNGDSRSVTLFGGLTVWAVIEIILINHREGEWQKPETVSTRYDVMAVVVGGIAFGAIAYFHAHLFGVPVVGGAAS